MKGMLDRDKKHLLLKRAANCRPYKTNAACAGAATCRPQRTQTPLQCDLLRIGMMVLLLLCIGASAFAFEQTDRNIYVGDIIALEITTQKFSSQELREKFRDFEIVEITAKPGGYALSLRTFETGEYTVLLGDKEIVIHVQSTLDDMQRDDIFEGGTAVIGQGFPFYWSIPLYISAGVLAVCGFILLKNHKKKAEQLAPHEAFVRRADSLSVESDEYFVELTHCFKEYLEKLYQFRIIGKTSTEIMNELADIQPLEPMLAAIGVWLTECDRMKFTGVKPSIEDKQEHCKKLLYLARKIEAQKEDAA